MAIAASGVDRARGVESAYAWRRLVVAMLVSTIGGVGRLTAALAAGEVPERAAALLKPYLDVIGALNERGAIKPGSHHRIQALLRTEQGDILRHCSGARRSEHVVLPTGQVARVRRVGDVDQIERRIVHEILVAGDTPGIDLRHAVQRVRLGVVAIHAAS